MQTQERHIVVYLHIDKRTKARYHFIGIKNDKVTERYTSLATLLQDRLEQIDDTEYPESKILYPFQDVWQLDNGKKKFFIINTNTEKSIVM
jgi:hypothetical protein